MLIDSTAARKARVACGLSQRELAKRAGLARFTIQGVESGRRNRARTKTLRSLAAALEVSVADIATAESDAEQLFLTKAAANA